MKQAQASEIFNQISREGGQSAALLFKRYGISAEPTPENIMNACIVYKKPFINDLYKAMTEETSAVDGDGNAGAFSNVVQRATEILTGISGILGGSGATPPIVEPSAPGPGNEPEPIKPAPEKKIFGISAPLFIGIVIIVVLGGVLIYLRKK